MRKFMKALAVAVVAAMAFAAGPTPQADAQVNFRGLSVQPLEAKYFGNQVAAADVEPVLVIKYFPGSSTSAATATTVETTAALVNFVVNGAAYTGLECPVSGALGGVINTADAACNTLGEVVDAINSSPKGYSLGYFRAAIVNGLRSDSSNAGFLADAADAEVRSEAGEVLYWDSSVLDDNTVGANFDQTAANLAKQFLTTAGSLGVSNPFKGQDSVLLYASENITNGGAVGDFKALCVVSVYAQNGSSTAVTSNVVGSETVTTMYVEPGAASGSAGTMSEVLEAGGFGCNDGRILVRIEASGADTSAVNLFASGFRFTRD